MSMPRTTDADRSGRNTRENTVSEQAERIMADVIERAFTHRPIWSARYWYSAVAAEFDRVPAEPPSRHLFERRFSAERKRRREQFQAASAQAVTDVGSAVGDSRIELLPDSPSVGRQDYELAVEAVTKVRSTCPRHAFYDYCQVVERAGAERVSEELFRAILLSPGVIDNVPQGMMPDWWRKKVAKLTSSGGR